MSLFLLPISGIDVAEREKRSILWLAYVLDVYGFHFFKIIGWHFLGYHRGFGHNFREEIRSGVLYGCYQAICAILN